MVLLIINYTECIHVHVHVHCVYTIIRTCNMYMYMVHVGTCIYPNDVHVYVHVICTCTVCGRYIP